MIIHLKRMQYICIYALENYQIRTKKHKIYILGVKAPKYAK